MERSAIQLFAHYTISPLLALGVDDSSELALALSCRFALGVFTMMQQDLPPTSQSGLSADSDDEVLDESPQFTEHVMECPVPTEHDHAADSIWHNGATCHEPSTAAGTSSCRS